MFWKEECNLNWINLYHLEPRGLIRLLELIFAICAFGTACNGGSSITITIFSNSSNGTASASWSYPYNLQDTPLILDLNMTQTQHSLSASHSIKSSAEFFVFTGVTSMLLCLAFLVVYVILDRQYRNKEILPLADLVITVLWMIFWLAGSAAWAQGVSNIRSSTNADSIWNSFTGTDGWKNYNVTISKVCCWISSLNHEALLLRRSHLHKHHCVGYLRLS